MFRINLKKTVFQIILGTALFVALSATNLNAQCSMMQGHGNHSGHSDHGKHNTDDGGDNTIIRKGIIDVYEIDVDKDGFVYQDPMDWNVISDKPGKCPLCGMKLKKVKIKEAIGNLKDNGFEVKE
ncbi:MAG: hypothetical protein CVV22_10590 [Ignavibacteriae bacterium HGW-Ignavibacteriae-1]|jgi:Cu(I)/Ag(I) efflux system membrane fusion protein/cobalt-zinc-cadmium efflux system membrane fusion protein|nr:MAG: hypothetical protein CVV22_10590 [Ignavibacteriae bacterium HGW-Ignavibacteriae-1]